MPGHSVDRAPNHPHGPGRYAIVMRETGEISSISEAGREPPWLSKDLADSHEVVRVDDDARVGMVRDSSGNFAWPPGHQNESAATRQAREAQARAAA